MTATARRMRMGARTITTGKQLRGQLAGLSTHVGPNALLRSSSYPAVTASRGTGPLLNVAPNGFFTWRVNNNDEFQTAGAPDNDPNGGLAHNWASGTSTVYAYNNNPGNYGGIVPAGGMVIDGYSVAAGTEIFQFMDLSAGGIYLDNGGSGSPPAAVFRGCRFRKNTDATGVCTITNAYLSAVYFLYCDLGGTGASSGTYSNVSLILASTAGVFLYRNYFSNQGTALQPNGSTTHCDVRQNYMENFVYQSGDHDNGISASGGGFSCFRWQQNYVVLEAVDANGQDITQTDAISLGSDGSPPANDNIGTGTNPDGTTGFQITHNYCAGGSDTYYLGQSGGGTPNTVTGLNFANNLLSTSSWPNGGNLGATNAVPPWNSSSPPNTKSNNLWADGPSAGTTFI